MLLVLRTWHTGFKLVAQPMSGWQGGWEIGSGILSDTTKARKDLMGNQSFSNSGIITTIPSYTRGRKLISTVKGP